MRKTFLGLATAAAAFAFADFDSSYILPLNHAAIQYNTTPVTDRVARLQQQLREGKVRLEYQDRHGYFWELDEVNMRLEKKMVEAFEDVLETSLKYTVDLRTAAYIVAINRVGMVTKMRGMYA